MNQPESVALITGASSGIGEVFARKLSERGCRLILVARRKERLEKLAGELRNAEILTADLANDADLSKVENRIVSESHLEFLVNNAGFGVLGLFHETPKEAQSRMHRLHILAIERLTHAALQGMIARRKGNIINVSSVAGFVNLPNSFTYGSTKAWINSFTEGLYVELKYLRSPVRVQALCPGFTRTEFQDTAGLDQSAIPKGLWMSADDVVDISLRRLERNQLIVIPGLLNRLFVAMHRRFPRVLQHFIAIKYGSSRRKK
jgi:short-subunit dehydrogenase